MKIRINKRSARQTRVRLQGELTIAHVRAVKAALDAHLGAARLVIDLGAVERCDSAGLQLLLVLRRTLGERVEFVEHALPVTKLVETLRAAGLLGGAMLLPREGARC